MRASFPLAELSPGEYPAYLTLAAVAIYGCVPETDQMINIGLLTVGLIGVEVLTTRRSAPPVWVLATSIVLWSGLYGATGRGSAVVGAWFAFWPIVLVAGFALAAGPLRPIVRWTIGAVGGAGAVAVARTGAIEPTIGPAIAAVCVAVPVTVLVGIGVVALSRSLTSDQPTDQRHPPADAPASHR